MTKELDDIGFVPDDIGFIPDNQEQSVQEGSNLEDIFRGGTQGLTMGFGDELYSALQNPTGALKSTGNLVGLTNIQDKDVEEYEKMRDLQRRYNEASKERSPWLYGGSELLGGIGGAVAAAPLLTVKGVGLGAKASQLAGSKLAPIAAKIAPEGANMARQGLGYGLEKVLPKAIGGATEGAVFGGAMGAGLSSDKDTIGSDIMGGVTSGAAVGGLIGGLAAPVGDALNVLKGEDNSLLRQTVYNPFIRAFEGRKIDTSGDKAFDEIISKLGTEESKPLQGVIKGLLDDTSTAFDDFLTKADEAGFKIDGEEFNPEDIVKSFENIKEFRPNYSKSERISNFFSKIENGELLTARDLQDAKVSFRDIAKQWKESTDASGGFQDAAVPLENLSKSIDEQLRNIPGYKELNEFYVMPRQQLGIEGLDRSQESSKQVENLLDEMYMESENPSGEHLISRKKEELFDTLKNMEINPTYGKLVKDRLSSGQQELNLMDGNRKGIADPIEAFKEHMRDISDVFQEAAGGRGAVQRTGSVKGIGNIAMAGSNLPRKIMQHTASGVGDLARATKDMANLVNLPNHILVPTAKKIQAIPSLNHYGVALERAANNGSSQMKNAAIFALMQNSEFRKMFQE